MPVSPADFALWARATGNKYPETAEEKIAAAPHAYDYAKNLGRTGQNPPTTRVGGTILYNSPESVQNQGSNAIFNAPVTPDNDAPKVSGTLDGSLTSQHFVNQEQNEVEDSNRQRNLIDTIGKTALAAGALAAGVALARNPGAQQAVRSAGTTLKENAQNIGNRVSSFLGGFGGNQNVDPSVIRNSGDITPPTTGQQYQQQEIPGLTKFVQQNKAAQTPPVTQSEVISTSQTFSPNNQSEQLNLLSHTADPWTGEYTPAQTQTQAPRQPAAVESAPVSYAQPEIPNLGPALTRKQEVIADVLSRMPITDYEREYTPRQSFASGPVSKEVLQNRIQSRRQELNALDQQRAELQAHLQAPNDQLAIPGLGLYSNTFRAQAIDPTTGEILHPRLIETTYSPEATVQPIGTQLSIPLDTATAVPSVGERVDKVLSQFNVQPDPRTGTLNFPTTTLTFGTTPQLSPTTTVELPATAFQSKQPIKITGASADPSFVRKTSVTKQVPWDIQEAPLAGAPELRGTPNVVRLAGARDIEAAAATAASQGVVPMGPFSSLTTGTEYQAPFDVTNPMAALNVNQKYVQLGIPGIAPAEKPSNLVSLVSSGIDPRVVTAGTQSGQDPQIAQRLRQIVLDRNAANLDALRRQAVKHPDPGVRSKTMTFLNQIGSLYDITQDPAVLEAGGQFAMPLQVKLPGGESVPTSSMFRAHKAIGFGPDSPLTQVQGLEQRLIGAQATHQNTQNLALAELGLSGGRTEFTPDELGRLSVPTQKQLASTQKAVNEAQNALALAKLNPVLYHIPENIQAGTKLTPVFSPTTGDISGMAVAPEERTMSVLERLNLEREKGVSRGDVGGVGRRREMLAAGPTELAYNVSPSSATDVEPVLYAVDTETGTQLVRPGGTQLVRPGGTQLVRPGDVNQMDILSGAAKPVRGEAVEVERLLGKWDRPYRGIEPSVIDPASFDPAAREALLKAYPERRTPEGLVYSQQAMESPGGGMSKVRGPAPAPGSTRAKAVARVAIAERARREAMAVPKPSFQLPKSQTMLLEAPAIPVNQFAPQRTIPGLGTVEEAVPNKMREVIRQAQINDLEAKYTGRNLQSALKAALQREAATQLNLF